MRKVALKAILKSIFDYLKKFRKPKQKTSTINIINNGNIVIKVSDVKVNVHENK